MRLVPSRLACCIGTLLLAACSSSSHPAPMQEQADSGGSHPPPDSGLPPADSGPAMADTGPAVADSGPTQGDAGRDATEDTGSPDSADSGPPAAPTLASGEIFGFATTPPTGPAEVNPYGIAIVPADFPTSGMLQPGDTLVSNFNDANNTQGAGTTIVRITAAGARSTFFTSTRTGMSGALGVLKSGFVVVGNVPNTGGGAVGTGSLQVLDPNGTLVQTITDATLLMDPWGMAIVDQGATAHLFVSNVVSGTITRLDVAVGTTQLTVNQKLQIASGYATRTDPAAFVVGPGGLAYLPATDTLYVASADEEVGGTEAGTVFAIAQATTSSTDGGKGTSVFASSTYLHAPYGLAVAANGNLLVANSDAVNADPMQPSEVVELTTSGSFVRQFPIDPNNGGAFGLLVGTIGGQSVLAAVDDNQSSLTLWSNVSIVASDLETSTVPPSGPADQNPYGVAIAPMDLPTSGMLQPGDVLVSNFNDPTNAQGGGTTIIRIAAAGGRSTFFTSTQPGLTGALGILKSGLVIVGNVPNTGGGVVGAGSLQVLDVNGALLQTLTDSTLLTDPWGLAISDEGATAQLFVSNVMSGAVTRLDVAASATQLTVNHKVQIASGYATRTDPAAFVIGPGGMAYDKASDTLFLASADEKIGGVEAGSVFAITGAGAATSDSGKGALVFANAMYMHGPVGLVLAPSGNLILANSDAVNADPNQPSQLVELTTSGAYVRQTSIDPSNGGAFGLTIGLIGGAMTLATVDDDQAMAALRSLP
jgi:hypothetical protein